MNKLVDKSALLLLCALAFSGADNFILPVVAMLSAVALSALSQCYTGTKLSLAIEIFYGILCFASPIFCFAIPLAIYDILWDKRAKVLIIYGLAFLLQSISIDVTTLILVISAGFTAFVLYKRTSRMEYLNQRLIETRDTSTELTMALMENNKHLLENQDNEIYLATLQERNRIAREIHDNVGHMLTRSILQLGALQIINKDENIGAALGSMKGTLDTAMTSIRESVHNLHDDSIDLKQAVTDCTKSIGDSYEINLDMDFSRSVPKTVKLCFIGIVKEALSNVVKHSNGDRVDIIIREHPGFYQLAVEDNGANDGIIGDSGIGLSNMRDRVNAIKGNFSATSQKDGFRIFVSVPKEKEGGNGK